MYGGGYDQPRGPPRAGIGAFGAAQNLPVPNLAPQEAPQGEKFSLFISGIPSTLDDRPLYDIFESVGQVQNVNRIRDASGQPKGFGFVDYGDAESVLRAIAVINGATVVGRDGEQKSLVVKADAKVRARLDAHEAGRASTSQLDSQMVFAKDALAETLERIRKASANSGQEEGEELNPDGTKKYRIPAHLQDLAPDDLPEESRGLITREIAFFRERAMKREEANKLAEEKRNIARRQAEDSRRFVGNRSQGPPPSNGIPARESPRPDQGRQWGRPDQGPSSGSRGFQGSPPPAGPSSDRRDYPPQQRPHDDRLDYERPVGFVPSSNNRPQSNGMSDEDIERARLRRVQEQNEQQYHQRLSRWQVRERSRTQALEREKQQKYYEQQDSDKRRQKNLEMCIRFDDDEEAETGNEPFIVDRVRWRKQRQQARRREIEQDAQDARREAEEAAALQKESEDFLARQADMLSSMSGTASLDPTATSGEPPKLKLLAVPTAEKKAEDAPKPKPKAAAAFAAADEDEDGAGKKKRELIPLSYSDDEDDEEAIERKRRKVKELVSNIPTDKAALWKYSVHWEELNERMVREKMRPFAAKKSVEYLGSEEEEVIDTVLENLRAHRGPMALTDELEPVLAEEAEEFVIKIYRHVNFETLCAHHRVSL